MRMNLSMVFPLDRSYGRILFDASGSPAILGPSRREDVAEEARTRGFASLTLVRFAFVAQ